MENMLEDVERVRDIQDFPGRLSNAGDFPQCIAGWRGVMPSGG